MTAHDDPLRAQLLFDATGVPLPSSPGKSASPGQVSYKYGVGMPRKMFGEARDTTRLVNIYMPPTATGSLAV